MGHRGDGRPRAERQRTRSASAPRQPATAPVRCSRARRALSAAEQGGEVPHNRRAGGALPGSAAPRGGAGRAPAARVALGRPRLGNAQRRMRKEECVDASERALRYFRSPAAPPSRGGLLDWALDPRPAAGRGGAADARRARRRPALGAGDLGRAALLAMLGRIDEAWALAEARADHLREVTPAGPSRATRVPRDDRDDRRRPAARVPPPGRADRGIPAPAATVSRVSPRLLLARDLCRLGRFEEAEP